MAKRICPFCKEKVKKDALICKYCRSELPPLPSKKDYQSWAVFLIILVLGVFVILFATSFEKPLSPIPSTTNNATKIAEIIKKKKQNYNDRFLNDKKLFEENIENHYSELVKLINNQQVDDALNKISLFKKFGQMNYKDVEKYINIKSLEEQRKFTKTEYFGDFSKAKKKMVTGKELLVVWEPYNQNLQRGGLSLAISDILSLSVEYDEIWEIKNTEFFTEEEIEKWWESLDISRFYWKNGKIQASVCLKAFSGNPITNEQFTNVQYHIISLHSRDEALKKAK